MHIYAEIGKAEEAGRITEEIRALLGHEALIEVSGARSGTKGNIGLYITASTLSTEATRQEIEKIEGIFFAIQE